MILVVWLCASITSPRAGCTLESVRLQPDVTPYECTMKAQEVLAEKAVLFGSMTIGRWGCHREHGKAAL